MQEGLSRAARRPANLETGDLRGPAQPNVLLERRSAKRSSAPYGSIDGAPWPAVLVHGQMDARPDGRAVRFYAHQLQGDPVVVVSRILENAKGVGVAGRSAADRNQDLFPSVVAEVGEGHAVTFV